VSQNGYLNAACTCGHVGCFFVVNWFCPVEASALYEIYAMIAFMFPEFLPVLYRFRDELCWIIVDRMENAPPPCFGLRGLRE
jgi:hypothetical protein